MLIAGFIGWAALVILIAGMCRVAATGERAPERQRLEPVRAPLTRRTREAHSREAHPPKNVATAALPKELRRSTSRRWLLTGVAAARRSLSS
jgi:hypothetical protein